MNYILETERLRLREFILSDADFIVALLNSPGWLQYIGDRNVRTEEQGRNYLENGSLKSYRANGYGLWLVELKEDKTPVGMCGIINRETLYNPDIGFAFLPEYVGKGYAFEAASATMAYARDVLKLTTILAITAPENQRSIKLLEKLGLRLTSTFNWPETNEELLLYSNQTIAQL